MITSNTHPAPLPGSSSTLAAAPSAAPKVIQSIDDWCTLASVRSGEIAMNEDLRKEIAKRTR